MTQPSAPSADDLLPAEELLLAKLGLDEPCDLTRAPRGGRRVRGALLARVLRGAYPGVTLPAPHPAGRPPRGGSERQWEVSGRASENTHSYPLTGGSGRSGEQP